MIPRGVWLIILLCLFPINQVWGMIGEEEIDISPSEHFTIVWAFEYATGGHLEMDITLLDTPATHNSNVTLQFLWCSDAQIDPLRSVQLNDVCKKPEFSRDDSGCDFQVSMGAPSRFSKGNSIHLNFTTSTTDWYRLLQLNCKQQAWSAVISYAAVNPGGEYLSLSQVPYKTLYVVVACLWIVLGAAWVYNWWRYRFFNVKLQSVLSLVPLTKLLLSFIELYYWRESSITGHFPTNIYWLWLVMVSVDWVMFHTALLICAKGWSITRKQLTRIERNRMITLVSILLIAYAIYKYFAGFLLFFLVIMYVLLLRYIFIAVVENTSSLLEQFDYVRRMEVDPQVTPVWIKLQMFRRFQVAMVIYISVDIIFHLWTTIFARSMPWIEDMMENTICALLSIAIGYIFAMRPFNPYFYRIVNHYTDSQGNQRNESSQQQQQQQQQQLDQNSLSESLIGHQHPPAGRSDESQYACEWHPGMPIPPIPHDTEAWLKETTEEEAPIILVENPFNADYHSNAQETVVVATPAYEGRGIIIATSRRTTSNASRASSADVSGEPDNVYDPVGNAADNGPPYPGETMLVRMQRSLSGALHMVRHRSSSGSSSSAVAPSSSSYRQLEEGTSSQELVTRHPSSTPSTSSTRQVATSSSSHSTSASSRANDPVEEKQQQW